MKIEFFIRQGEFQGLICSRNKLFSRGQNILSGTKSFLSGTIFFCLGQNIFCPCRWHGHKVKKSIICFQKSFKWNFLFGRALKTCFLLEIFNLNDFCMQKLIFEPWTKFLSWTISILSWTKNILSEQMDEA